MSLEHEMASAFRMDDAVWARHANPLSVWTRFAALPLITLAIWSRTWIGIWCLIPIALALFWTWVNPRCFPIPASTNNWASKCVLGERVWLKRKEQPIPAHHARAASILAAVTGLGIPLLAWGLITLSVWPTLTGIAWIYFGKLWFLDRMVWLFDDMKDAVPEYRAWLYGPARKEAE